MNFILTFQSKFYPVLQGLSVKSPIPHEEHKPIVSHETLKKEERKKMLRNGENMKVRTKSGTIYWLHNINGKLKCFTLSGAERKVTKEMKELAGMGSQEVKK